MKKIIIVFCVIQTCLLGYSQVSIELFKDAVFYDGYANLVNEPTPPDVIRLRNDLVTKKLTNEQIDAIGSTLTIDITIGALCDNYDRIGGVNLVFTPTGSITYNPDSVMRIEIGRFITPFMNKNSMPDTVPFRYEANNLVRILTSPEWQSQYDFWIELEVFGVPYAANQEVAGCSGRMDVFEGTVRFLTNEQTLDSPNDYLAPLAFKAPFNNYNANATDQVGTTTRTIEFNVTEQIYHAQLYLITSNHGAGFGGEEYVRRWHYVMVDGDTVLTYLPGGKSCEPYRVYNTQGNGIYGAFPQTESWWTAWNNWCPGDTISVREINLGSLTPGLHTFQIKVPEAQFQNADGNFPLSLYLQGSRTDVAGFGESLDQFVRIYPNPADNILHIEAKKGAGIQELFVLDATGKLLEQTFSDKIYLSGYQAGTYLIQIHLKNGQTFQYKFLVK